MKFHHKGNVLIITLVIFLIMTSGISAYMQVVISHARNYQSLQMVNEQRLMLNGFLAYIKYTNANDILLSDYVTTDDIVVDYTVDDMGDYYFINAVISGNTYELRFNFDLNKEKNFLTRFEFSE